MSNPIVVGRLGAVYGIKGWLKVNSFTDNAESIFEYAPWLLQQGGQWREVRLAGWKRHNNGLLCKLDGIDLREEAQALVGADIGVSPEQLPSLPEGEYYWRDLIGCRVVTTKGYELGEVSELMETGSNDVLVVQAKANDAFGMKERLIPFLEEQVIKQIDLAGHTIEVDWDPGF
ncbi:ribosome maturation factor RimM [Pseudaeromonas paramecii]|uniref:Ribosome maturation factor RimM n=1 Tax=Pseudaeromonas paramecii TaxID=2138166 RepID=A0ABP8QBX8_9GAMM